MLILFGFIMYNLAGITLDIAIYERETPFLLWRVLAILGAAFIFIISWHPRLLFKSQEYEKQIDYDKISDIHGKIFVVKTVFNTLKIIPLYHPAVATYNPNNMDTLFEDFKKIKLAIQK